MRLTRLVACLVLLAVSLVSAQWLEKTIYLPDSLGGMTSPGCLAYNSANNTIYVGGDACVIAIDGATNQKVARIPVASGVRAICYNPQSNKVYCANAGSGNVTVIDGATDSVIATVAAGNHPSALCHNPAANKVYCANDISNEVTVIDCASNQVIASVDVGRYPWALCANPQDNKVYCANHDGNDITIIDGATNQVLATVATGDGPWDLWYDSLGNKVYCANYSSGNVTVIDGASNQVQRTIDVGHGPLDFCQNPAQNRVYVANYRSSSISVLRDSGGGIEESFKPQASSSKPAATVVRGVLFLPPASGVERGASSVLLDISGRKVLDLKPGPNDVSRFAPGVYFIREQSVVSSQHSGTENGVRRTVYVRKVVLTD